MATKERPASLANNHPQTNTGEQSDSTITNPDDVVKQIRKIKRRNHARFLTSTTFANGKPLRRLDFAAFAATTTSSS